MKKLFLCWCLTAAWVSSSATPVSRETARLVATNFLHSKGVESEAAIQLLHSYSTSGHATLYIFTVQNNAGFAIVAADDIIQPVLAYSTTNGFEKSQGDISPEIQYWLEGYSSQIGAAVANHQPAAPQTVKEWQYLLLGNSGGNIAQKVTGVSPLLTTTWDQLPNYNALCPAVPPGSGSQLSHAPTGCVATAMAQIMKYWGSPAQGVGTHSYSSSTLGGTLSADFGNTTYNWGNMPNTLNASATTSQINDVALLMLHCGIAVDMDYSANGSGALVISYQPYYSNANAEDAFKDYFKYSSSIHGEVRSDYSETNWISMLKAEIDSGRPVLYAGYGSGGGHAFVFDGYDNNDNFHINWGWSGYGNGYYTVNNLEPTFVGTGGGVGNFNDGQQALFGIIPGVSHLKIGSDYTTSADSILYNQPFSVGIQINNIGAANFDNGLLALFAITSDSSSSVHNVVLLDSTRTSIAASGNYTYSFSTQGVADLTEGTYQLVYKHGADFMDLSNVENGIVNNGSQTLTVYSAAPPPPPPSGIEDVSQEFWAIYPNPASDFLTIKARNANSAIEKVTITDLGGRKIWERSGVDDPSISVNVTTFTPGVYFVILQTKTGSYAKKISIQNR